MKTRNKRNALIAVFPFLLGVCVALGAFFICRGLKIEPSVARVEFTLNAIITIAATLSGFALTSFSVLVSAASSPIMVDISKKGGMPELICHFATPLVSGVALLCYGIVQGATIKEGASLSVNQIYGGIGLCVAFIYSFVVTCIYLFRITSRINVVPVKSVDIASAPEGINRIGRS